MVDTLRHDLGYALRSFRRSPLFAAGVAITIGFGLGFAGTAFAVINAYVFRTFDFKDPHALYEVGWASRSGGQATSGADAHGVEHTVVHEGQRMQRCAVEQQVRARVRRVAKDT